MFQTISGRISETVEGLARPIGYYLLLIKVKGGDIAFNGTPISATERYLPYGITRCYLPPDTGERAPP